jgi:hypothetical protein
VTVCSKAGRVWSALRTNATTSRIAASERRLALVLTDGGVQHTGLGQRATTAVYSMNKSRAGSCSRISPASIPDWRKWARGFMYGWFACVFMGLMWWLGFLASLVLFFYEAAEDTISELLRFALSAGRSQCR